MRPQVDIKSLAAEVRNIHDRFPRWTLDNAFVHWFLEAFLVADATVAASCVTGVSHDKGVDGVFIDDNVGRVFLLQGKFHPGKSPPSEKRTDVLGFAALAKILLGAPKEFREYLTGIDPLVAKKLEEARLRIDRRSFPLELYYVTTGSCSGPLKSEAEANVGQARGRAAITVLDRKNVLSLLVDYLGGAAPPVPYLDLDVDQRGVSGSDRMIQRFDETAGIESWVFSMSATKVGVLYNRAGDRLFARNIRGFLGDTAINEGMGRTLKDRPELFWYFNNGVTIACDSARLSAERGQTILRVTNPQVINGQQTTRMLAEVGTKSAAVLIRVISVPRESQRSQEQFEQLVSNIVAATNWQNAILPSDLRSNDIRQVTLQRDLAKFGYHYVRKRQTKREARRLFGDQYKFMLRKDELAQVTAACDCDPYEVRGGKEGLFEQPLYDVVFDGRDVRQYLAMYWLGRIVKYHGGGYPDRAYAKWHVTHFLWSRISPTIRKRAHSDQFRYWCERSSWPEPLDRATVKIYLSMLDFFRLHRGKGAKAVDISNFFYRPHQHEKFERYWQSSLNKRRATVRKLLKDFATQLASAGE